MMQDGKALQAGTSHFLGQNFAKAFDVQFQNQEGKLDHVYATSWGVSTRLIGALVMAHSDDDGLVLPPKLAPIHLVIVPISKSDAERSAVLEMADKIQAELIPAWTVRVDSRENYTVGWKFNEWELKGVPIRIEIGPKDLAQGQAIVVRRDTREKRAVPFAQLKEFVAAHLVEMQTGLFQRAAKMREEKTRRVDDYASFKAHIEQEMGGFALAGWCGSAECEASIQEETKATIRCIPLDRPEEKGTCVKCGKPSDGRVLMAKAY
jgi:prolyl-tRNA synthetase